LFGPELADYPKSFQEMKDLIRNGNNGMPPFDASKISDADIGVVFSYFTGKPIPQ